jgi:hypothetical protein
VGLLFFFARARYPSSQELENQEIVNGVDSPIGEAEDVSDQPAHARVVKALSDVCVN